MILTNVSKHIVVNAGHHDGDTGAIFGEYIERDLCKRVRDEMLPLLSRAGFTVSKIPDNLTLAQSIQEANRIAPSLASGLCIDVHFNYSSNPKVNGSEAYYGVSDTSKEIARTLSENVSHALGINNRGAKPDTQTAVGSLGWIRQTKAWATLVEVAYISSAEDMVEVDVDDGFRRSALGIVNGICELFGVPKISLETRDELKTQLEISAGVIEGEAEKIRDVASRL